MGWRNRLLIIQHWHAVNTNPPTSPLIPTVSLPISVRIVTTVHPLTMQLRYTFVMPSKTDYTRKIAALSQLPLYSRLSRDTSQFLERCGSHYWMSFQELRQLMEMAIDLVMWREDSLEVMWERAERAALEEGKSDKTAVLDRLNRHYNELLSKTKEYPTQRHFEGPKNRREVVDLKHDDRPFGLCPVYSERTVCCNLYTVDSARGCGFSCSYCSIQSFYTEDQVGIDAGLADKLNGLTLDPQRNYHIGSGQASDSLLWGNRGGILDALMAFARRHENVLLELKTKSKNIRYFEQAEMPKNVFVSWSLNTPTIISNEEHLTATLDQRIAAARRIADLGIPVGFHLHPMVCYRGWQEEYKALIQRVLDTFLADEVALISFGTLTYSRSAIRSVRKNVKESKVLQMPMEDAAGKFSYPDETKLAMFALAWKSFAPWQDQVFFYLCMEQRDLWERLFGDCFDSNTAFETALFEAVSEKL